MRAGPERASARPVPDGTAHPPPLGCHAARVLPQGPPSVPTPPAVLVDGLHSRRSRRRTSAADPRGRCPDLRPPPRTRRPPFFLAGRRRTRACARTPDPGPCPCPGAPNATAPSSGPRPAPSASPRRDTTGMSRTGSLGHMGKDSPASTPPAWPRASTRQAPCRVSLLVTGCRRHQPGPLACAHVEPEGDGAPGTTSPAVPVTPVHVRRPVGTRRSGAGKRPRTVRPSSRAGLRNQRTRS